MKITEKRQSAIRFMRFFHLLPHISLIVTVGTPTGFKLRFSEDIDG